MSLNNNFKIKNVNVSNGKMLIIFDNDLGPIPLFTVGIKDDQELKQNIAIRIQQTMSMCNDWQDGCHEACFQTNGFVIFAYFFIIPTDQDERFQGETLGTLCYIKSTENISINEMYTKVTALKEKAKNIVEVLNNSFVYHGNKQKTKLPILIPSMIEKWA